MIFVKGKGVAARLNKNKKDISKNIEMSCRDCATMATSCNPLISCI